MNSPTHTHRYSIAPFTKSVSQGASTQVFCATAPSSELTSGGWYVVFSMCSRARDFQSFLHFLCFNDVTRIALTSLTHATKKLLKKQQSYHFLLWFILRISDVITRISRVFRKKITPTLTLEHRYEDMHLVSGPQIDHVKSQWNHSVNLLRRLPLTPSPSSSSSSFHHPLLIIFIHIASYLIFFGSANLIFGGSQHTTPSTPFGLKKIKAKFPNHKLVSREIRRSMYSAIIDSIYHILLRSHVMVKSQQISTSAIHLVPIFAFWGRCS